MKLLSDEIIEDVIGASLMRGGEYADVYVERERSVLIQLEDSKIEKLSSGTDGGVGVRVVFDGKTAYAYSNDFSRESLLSVADSVSRAVRNSNRSESMHDLRRKVPSLQFPISQSPEDVPMKKKIALMEGANRVARDFSNKVKQALVMYRDSKKNVLIATSEGLYAEDERIYTLGLVQVIAEQAGILQTAYEPAGGLTGFELFEEQSLEGLARDAARKAVALLDARKAPGGRMPVVISSQAGGTMIHEAVGHGLEADLVQQGLSVYRGKVGEKIASSLVTIVDDSTLQGKRGSFVYDDEGMESQRTVLVDRGILRGYMYDRITAMKEGVASTGNGRRQSYRDRPIPRMTNTFIVPGQDSPEEIIKSVDRGFLVHKMGGGQVNTVTGEFVFEVSEGYLIEGGKAGDPVRGATLTGSGPDVLKSIDKVGSDIGFAIGTCGKDAQGVPVSDAMPTVRIPEIVVGGEV